MKQKHYNVVIFGEKHVVKPFYEYLGMTHDSARGVLYFEFPQNPKFKNEQFQRLFGFDIKFFVGQAQILSTIFFPKEFKWANGLIFVFDLANLSSLETCYQYLRKFYLKTHFLPPIQIIGYLKAGENRQSPDEDIFLGLKIQNSMGSVFQQSVDFFEIEEDKNESLLIWKLKKFIQGIELGLIYGQESEISIENKLEVFHTALTKSLEEKIDFGEKLRIMAALENKIQRPITHNYLVKNYGWNSENAVKFLNLWEKREIIPGLEPSEEKDQEKQPEGLIQLRQMAIESFEQLQTLNLAPNLINLIQIGVKPKESKKILYILHKEGYIPTIAYHKNSQQYNNFKSIIDFIILHNSEHVYSKSVKEEKGILFSGLIQAIETARDRFLEQQKAIEALKRKRIRVEFLQFGEMFSCLIGNTNLGLKVILRFKEPPSSKKYWIKQIKAFMLEYENTVPLENTLKKGRHEKIQDLSERLFYKHFNPFPAKIDVIRPLHLKDKKKKTRSFTMMEEKILAYLDDKKNDLDAKLIENLIANISKKNSMEIARSDIVLLISDLLEDKVIAQNSD